MKQFGIFAITILVLIAVAKWKIDQAPYAKTTFSNVAGQIESNSWSPTGETITLAEYMRLRDGMSYLDVRIAIGESGSEVARHHIDGIDGVTESISTVMYSWANEDGSNANAMFQNDKLIQKAQFGLR